MVRAPLCVRRVRRGAEHAQQVLRVRRAPRVSPLLRALPARAAPEAEARASLYYPTLVNETIQQTQLHQHHTLEIDLATVQATPWRLLNHMHCQSCMSALFTSFYLTCNVGGTYICMLLCMFVNGFLQRNFEADIFNRLS